MKQNTMQVYTPTDLRGANPHASGEKKVQVSTRDLRGPNLTPRTRRPKKTRCIYAPGPASLGRPYANWNICPSEKLMVFDQTSAGAVSTTQGIGCLCRCACQAHFTYSLGILLWSYRCMAASLQVGGVGSS